MAKANPRDPPPQLPEDSVLSLEEYLAMQRAIGDETRYRVVAELMREGERSASELADALDVPSNKLHYHLDRLQSVGLVQNRKREERGADGLYSYYVATSLARTLMTHGVAELIRREEELLRRYA